MLTEPCGFTINRSDRKFKKLKLLISNSFSQDISHKTIPISLVIMKKAFEYLQLRQLPIRGHFYLGRIQHPARLREGTNKLSFVTYVLNMFVNALLNFYHAEHCSCRLGLGVWVGESFSPIFVGLNSHFFVPMVGINI